VNEAFRLRRRETKYFGVERKRVRGSVGKIYDCFTTAVELLYEFVPRHKTVFPEHKTTRAFIFVDTAENNPQLAPNALLCLVEMGQMKLMCCRRW